MSFYTEQLIEYKQRILSDEFVIAKIIAAKRYIDAHYADAIDLEEISQAAHISKFHFIRLFKRYYGRTPGRYLVETRIAMAKMKLKAGQDIATVCLEVGFQSVPSFTTLFRKLTGKTPAYYKAGHHLQKSNFR
jgi:AraC-like DNA-binding protein